MTNEGEATLRPAPVPIAVAAPTAFASASTCDTKATGHSCKSAPPQFCRGVCAGCEELESRPCDCNSDRSSCTCSQRSGPPKGC